MPKKTITIIILATFLTQSSELYAVTFLRSKAAYQTGVPSQIASDINKDSRQGGMTFQFEDAKDIVTTSDIEALAAPADAVVKAYEDGEISGIIVDGNWLRTTDRETTIKINGKTIKIFDNHDQKDYACCSIDGKLIFLNLYKINFYLINTSLTAAEKIAVAERVLVHEIAEAYALQLGLALADAHHSAMMAEAMYPKSTERVLAAISTILKERDIYHNMSANNIRVKIATDGILPVAKDVPRPKSFEAFKEFVQSNILTYLPLKIKVALTGTVPATVETSDLIKFYVDGDNFERYVDEELFADYKTVLDHGARVIYEEAMPSSQKWTSRAYDAEKWVLKYLCLVYVMNKGARTEREIAQTEIEKYFTKFIIAKLGSQLQRFNDSRGRFEPASSAEPADLGELNPSNIEIDHSSFLQASPSRPGRTGRQYLIIKYKGSEMMLYRSESHNRWKRLEAARATAAEPLEVLKPAEVRIAWIAKPLVEHLNNLDQGTSDWLDSELKNKTPILLENNSDPRLVQRIIRLGLLVDIDGNIYFERRGKLAQSHYEVDKRRYDYPAWHHDAKRQVKTDYITATRKDMTSVESRKIFELKDRIRRGQDVKILFVCAMNSQRSFLMEMMAKTIAKKHGLDNLAFGSCGILGMGSAHQILAQYCIERGISGEMVRSFRPQQINERTLRQYDYVIAADISVAEESAKVLPAQSDKIILASSLFPEFIQRLQPLVADRNIEFEMPDYSTMMDAMSINDYYDLVYKTLERDLFGIQDEALARMHAMEVDVMQMPEKIYDRVISRLKIEKQEQMDLVVSGALFEQIGVLLPAIAKNLDSRVAVALSNDPMKKQAQKKTIQDLNEKLTNDKQILLIDPEVLLLPPEIEVGTFKYLRLEGDEISWVHDFSSEVILVTKQILKDIGRINAKLNQELERFQETMKALIQA